jgi:hypothetical protein
MNSFNCCKDLQEAIEIPEKSFFSIEENGVLFLTIGFTQTEQGTGWFNQAVIFCPFCGKQLQDRTEIAHKAQASEITDSIN